jgi:hypothetical protein
MYRGYTTNNMYSGFPPLMADGRTVTASYQPNAVISENIIREENLNSSWKYRNYMTHNADKIREYNYLDALTDAGYTQRPVDVIAPSSNTPYLFSNIMDTTRKAEGDSDLKSLYLSREQLNARKMVPTLTQEQFLSMGGGIPQKMV